MDLRKLKTNIGGANSIKELKEIVSNIPKQKNGERTAMARHLDNAFWYIDLDNDIPKIKEFMFGVIKQYEINKSN